jgi:hypothetical protein
MLTRREFARRAATLALAPSLASLAAAGEVGASLTRKAQSIALNNVTPAAAADQFMTEATKAVNG